MTTIMLTPSEAVVTAKKLIKELAPDEEFNELRLEGINLSSDESEWRVTLGYYRRRQVDVKGSTNSALMYGITQGTEIEHRVYKTLTLDAETGVFKSLEMG